MLQLLNWIKKIFRPRYKNICGGQTYCIVKDSLFRDCGRIHYRRPSSDEVLTYLYEIENRATSEKNIKEIEALKEKDKKTVTREFHRQLIRDISLPFAEKIFLYCEGFIDEKGNTLDGKDGKEQFENLKKYKSHLLLQLVFYAYQEETVLVKKN